MIGSIVAQNKSFSDAAKTPKDTSHRSEEAKKYSAQVSSQRPAQKVAASKEQISQTSKPTGSRPKGSFEGLMHSSSTMLQFNGAGYSKKSLQTARYSKKDSFKPLPAASSFTSDKTYSIMNNYSSMMSEKSSSERIANIIKNNSF